MSLTSDNLRYILGLKLRTLRQDQGMTLKDLASESGLSVSYLSEIEKGKKYPKPDKLLRLAEALGVPFDELVSLRVDDALGPVKEALSSTFLQEFPFELFGVQPEDLYALLADDPVKVGSLIRTFLEVGRTYDVRVEQFLRAALRSYQQMHANFFEDLEEAADDFRRAAGFPPEESIPPQALRAVLEATWGYRVEETLGRSPELGGFRSVFIDGERPRLLVNGELLPSQKAFVLAREIGYRRLGLKTRAVISTWLEIGSFEEILNNFKASYFAGAVLIEAGRLERDLRRIFRAERWDGEALLGLLPRYGATPEMLFYRLTELVPRRFGLREIFFLRFSREGTSGKVALTKLFNMSRVAVPHGIGPGEHYCRRWPAVRLLARTPAEATDPTHPVVSAQRSRFLDEDVEFFVVSMARPLVLARDRLACVSIGFLVNREFRRRVRFWDDPAIPRVDVHLTCERCPLAAAECAERVVPPTVLEQRRLVERQKRALRQLLG